MQKLNRTTPALLLIIFVIGCALIGASPALAQYSSPVRVLNSTAQPVPVSIIATNPRTYAGSFSFDNSPTAELAFSIPTGGCFVMEQVSYFVNIPAGFIAHGSITFSSNGTEYTHWILLQRVGAYPNFDRWIATSPIHIHVDSNSTVKARLLLNTNITIGQFWNSITISGYQLPN